MPEWKLSDGTTNQSVAAWGLMAPTLGVVNQGADELRLQALSVDIDDSEIFSYGDSITLYKDSTVWFKGKVIDTPRIGSGQVESHEYVVAGAWRDLDRLTFEQAWIQYDSSTETKTHVVLGKDYLGSELDVGEVLKEILDFAISKSVGLAYVQTELDALDTVAPYDDQTDITCGEAIRSVLRWYPDVVTWIDYTQTTPTLHFTRRGSASSVSYDCTAGTLIESLNIKSLPDLVRSGVIVNYEKQNDESEWNAVERDIYPVSTTSGLSTLQLTIVIGTNGVLDTAPTGLAETLYEATSVLHYEGVLVLSEEECSSGPRPGKVLNLTNGVSAWSTMKAVIQEVQFDISTGRTAIRFGPPSHLGPQDYIALLQGNRKRNAGSGYGPGDGGSSGLPPAANGDMIKRTTVGWGVMHPTTYSLIVGTGDGFDIHDLGSTVGPLWHDGAGGVDPIDVGDGGEDYLLNADGGWTQIKPGYYY